MSESPSGQLWMLGELYQKQHAEMTTTRLLSFWEGPSFPVELFSPYPAAHLGKAGWCKTFSICLGTAMKTLWDVPSKK